MAGFQASPGSINIPNLGDNAGDFYLRAFAAPGAAIAKNRDFYGEMKAEQDRAAAAAAGNQTERERIAESRRQFEAGQAAPSFLELPVEGGAGTQYHRFVRGQDQGPLGGIKPYPISTVGGSAADIKSVFDAAGAVTSIDQQIDQLNQARELNRKGFTSGGALTGPATSFITGFGGYAEKGLNALGIGTPESMKSTQEAAAAQDLMMHILTPASLAGFRETLLKGGVSNRDVDLAINNSLADPRLDAPTREKMIDAAIGSLKAQRANAFSQAQALASRAPGAVMPTGAPGGAPTVPGPAKPLAPELQADLKQAIANIGALPPDQQAAAAQRIKAKLIELQADPAAYGL